MKAKMMMMQMMAVMLLIVVLAMMGGVEGKKRRDRNWLRQRGCRRAAGEGVTQDGAGTHFVWTRSGLDEDDLRMTYREGAFAPEGSTVVHMYPRNRGQRQLGLVPAKLVYDFTENPVIAIRKARRGKGVCIVMRSDVDSYDEMLTQLEERNMTNTEVASEDTAERLVIGQPADPAQFSEVLRNVCTQDACGNPVDSVFFWALPEETSDDEEELQEEEDDAHGVMSYMLFNELVSISGQQRSRRMWRQGQRARRGHGAGEPYDELSRDQRREQRRQQRYERRQQRREQRRQERLERHQQVIEDQE